MSFEVSFKRSVGLKRSVELESLVWGVVVVTLVEFLGASFTGGPGRSVKHTNDTTK